MTKKGYSSQVILTTLSAFLVAIEYENVSSQFAILDNLRRIVKLSPSEYRATLDAINELIIAQSQIHSSDNLSTEKE